MNITTDIYRSFAICLILASAIFAVFWPLHQADFVYYDDPDYVSENPHIQSGFSFESITWAFTTGHAANWHPMTWLSHMLDYKLFGLDAGWHHVTNLLFHIANTLLLFIVLKRMTADTWKSAFVAALFAIHPLHVESVAWIAERKDVLSTFFWMLTMLCYIKYTERPGIWRYLLTLLVFTLGLMAKPMLVTLPFVLLLLDYWPLERFALNSVDSRTSLRPRKFQFRLLAEKIPFMALSTVSSIVTFLVQSKAVVAIDRLPLKLRISNCIVVYQEYISKTIWPSHLAVFYPNNYSTRLTQWRIVLAAFLLIGLTICSVRLASKYKYLLVGWLWYLGTLVPVIGLVQVGEQAMADRYTYISLIGLFIIAAWGITDLLARWKYRNIALAFAAILVILLLSITARIQVGYWRAPLALFEHAIEATNGNYMIHHFLAQYLYKQGQIDKGIEHDLQATIIEPNFPQANNTVGFALVQKKRVVEAIPYFKKAIQIKSDYADAYCNAGGALSDIGQYDEAARYLSTALKIDPNITEANYNLGIIYAKKGKLDKAVKYLTTTIRLKPDLPKAYSNLGAVLIQQGKLDEAITNLNKALQLDPNNETTKRNLNIAIEQKNQQPKPDN